MRVRFHCVCLLVLLLVGHLHAFTLMTYNTAGNGKDDWSTNAAQVQAIGRILRHANADVIAFNEIPYQHTWEMTNWVNAYLPGYFLAANSATDGFIRSVIASRFPITRSKSWLHSSDLNPYGFTNSNFTRDLFEAEIDAPGFAQHVHVFVTHLKAFSDSESAAKRAAEASAISNFFVTTFLPANGQRAYVLCGDMNEDVARPPSTSGNPMGRLLAAATGLQLIMPTNAFTGKEFTYSSSSPSQRLDYILPGASLLTNMMSAQVFRTAVLAPLPPLLNQLDDRTASDHLPVIANFVGNDPAPRLMSAVSNGSIRLSWNAATQRQYVVETSTNLAMWRPLATNTAASTNLSWTNTVSAAREFFRVQRLP